MPGVERSYRVKGYPILPGVFILFTGFYLATTVYNDIDNYARGKVPFINSVLGMLLTAIGIPLYYYFKRKSTIVYTNYSYVRLTGIFLFPTLAARISYYQILPYLLIAMG